MNRRELIAAVKQVAWSKKDVDRIAATLLRSKVRVYRKTLREIAADRGVKVEIKMSRAVKEALAADALRSAESMARTRNAAALRIATKLNRTGLSDKRIAEDLRILINQRQAKKREMVAITEAYSPHADATLAFYRDAGGLNLMSFGGRPETGDEPPECDLCKAIIAGNPWSVEQAIRIGTPHPQCRQSWHPQSGSPLPGTVVAGETIAGVVGEQSLVIRAGDLASAIEAVRDRSV